MALCTLPAWRPPQIDQGGLETSLQTQAHLEVEVLQPVTVTKLMFSQCWRCSHTRGRSRQLKLSLTATAPKQNNLPAASTAGAQRWCSRTAAKQLTFECCSHWHLRDTRTHIVVLGSCMGLVPALQSIGKPPPALHIPQILEKSGCRELQFLTARFAPAGSTNSAPWVCSLPNTLPYSS